MLARTLRDRLIMLPTTMLMLVAAMRLLSAIAGSS